MIYNLFNLIKTRLLKRRVFLNSQSIGFLYIKGENHFMEIGQCFLPETNKLVSDYIQKGNLPFYHYPFQEKASYETRLEELWNRDFPREQLAEHIRSFMEPLGLTKEIENSLEKLKARNSVVVIGGQQVGLLTGPLYSIYKMMSIILLARQKEKELNVPVVPVFWMAGEDHDIYEVNHLFLPGRDGMEKRNFPAPKNDRQMMSKTFLEKDKVRNFCLNFIADFGETEFTKSCIEIIDAALEKTTTYTDFFHAISHSMFKHHGLLFVDSAHPDLRQIERPFFEKLLVAGKRISENLYRQQSQVREYGYHTLIESASNNLHLFIERDGERILLHHDLSNDKIEGKGVTLTIEELVEIAAKSPQLLSNNVVTRPLMQEWLFPTIAFIAGPGEIRYWAELKQVFELFGLKMPPIVPRLNITLLERAVERDLDELGISVEQAIQFGVNEEKEAKTKALRDIQLETFFHETLLQIEGKYEALIERALKVDDSLAQVTKKNREIVKKQVKYLENKVQMAVLRKFDELWNKYERINCSLHPEGSFQERYWNIFYFFNLYGIDFIDSLMELPFTFNGSHYIIKI